MIELRKVSVLFGSGQHKALQLLDAGADRDTIKRETGLVLGVQDANLRIGRGEICVLMGLSGSGKSSLLRCINGLNTASRGQVLIEHHGGKIDFAAASAELQREIRTHRISMVFQSFALMPWLSVEDNVAFGLRQQGLGKSELRERVQRQLELVGLKDWARQRPSELSGGMRQRVGLARALATESDILLMDEPFSALDPLIRQQLQDELLAMQEQLQKTIVFVSHDLDEALKLGTCIAIMKDGRIVQQGRPEDIVLSPADDYVKRFVAHTNPLNVLPVRALMRPLDDMPEDDQANRCVSRRYDTWVVTDDDVARTRVRVGEQMFDTQTWQPGDDIDALRRLPTRIPARTLMRDAVEICYATAHSPLVEHQGRIIGAIGEREIYRTLLSKHLQDAA